MGDKKPSLTDVTEHQKVFEGLIRISAYVIAGVAVILIFLAIVGT